MTAKQPVVERHEPFGLSPAAIRRIAEDAGLEDDNDARRVLRAFEFSKECAKLRRGR
ncbi:MAG TPA: hypothetical protein VLJ76_05135 [Gaiellaceae bacterium]|nr:hypothetical protein [Gaiellaceae bacterium]